MPLVWLFGLCPVFLSGSWSSLLTQQFKKLIFKTVKFVGNILDLPYRRNFLLPSADTL